MATIAVDLEVDVMGDGEPVVIIQTALSVEELGPWRSTRRQTADSRWFATIAAGPRRPR